MQRITPFLWFKDKAFEAATFYTSIFENSKILSTSPMSTRFRIEGLEYIAFNGGPALKINPAISLFITCATQKEVDYYWRRLSAGGKVVQCGWVRDKFGVSWQVVPEILGDLLGDPDRAKADRAMKAMLGMKKLSIHGLMRAHAGKTRAGK